MTLHGIKGSLSILVAAAAILGLGLAAQAQDYPSKPIDAIVPIPAGSAADGVARIVLPKMEKILGQPIVIENIGGAAHLPGMAQASKQEPDGYHLLWASIADFSANPGLYKKLPYSPEDFTPIGRVSAQSLILAVPTSSGVNTVDELVAKAKKKSLAYASTGIGNSNHLLGEMLMQNTGIKMRHIPYEGGSAAVLDLMRGDIDVMFYSLSQFQPGLQSGELKLLGVTASERSKFLPELPTMKELGYGDVLVTSWYGLFAPKGTAPEQINVLFKALNEALNDPKVVAALENTGTEVWASKSPEEFAEFLTAERARYVKLMNDIGLEKR
jgi:tripartite-type tricarboxylate transporter receptor subunit TctC